MRNPECIEWAERQRLSPHSRNVLLTLAFMVGPECTCWPSTKDLMKRTGLKRRTLFNALEDLEESQYIQRTGRWMRSTIFQLFPSAPVAPGSNTSTAVLPSAPVAPQIMVKVKGYPVPLAVHNEIEHRAIKWAVELGVTDPNARKE